MEDAKAMVKAVPGNTFVKIPACPEGFKAIRELKNAGIATSCTAVYTFNQAMLAAMAGASYVAVYVSRLDKNGGDGIEVVRRIKQAFVAHNIDCVVSAASSRLRFRSKRLSRPVPITLPSTLRCLRPWRFTP